MFTGTAAEPARTMPRSITADTARRLLLHGVLLIGSALFLLPFFWSLSTSLKPANEVFAFPPEVRAERTSNGATIPMP